MPKNRHIPERSCVACGVKMPKPKLIRLVRTGQGPLIVDTTGKEPGRGAYLCSAPECWTRALGKRALERGFKQEFSSQDLESVRDYFKENIAPRATAH